MERRIVYIAGPYGGETESQIARNVARACALGRLAAVLGYVPLVPHGIGWLGCHGSRTETGNDGSRVRALACGIELATIVAFVGGELWAIGDMQALSHGTGLEVAAHLQHCADPDLHPRIAMVWEAWVPFAQARGFDLLSAEREIRRDIASGVPALLTELTEELPPCRG